MDGLPQLIQASAVLALSPLLVLLLFEERREGLCAARCRRRSSSSSSSSSRACMGQATVRHRGYVGYGRVKTIERRGNAKKKDQQQRG